MATLYASRNGVAWSETTPVYSPIGGGNLGVAVGTYEIATNPTIADVIRFCKVPRGAVVIGGWLTGDDIDTGTETLDIDIGWEANGVDTADPDGFGNMGLLTGDTVTEVIPVASIFRNLQGVLNSEGTKAFGAETWISGTVVAAAAAGGTGTISVKVLYYVP